MLAALIAAGLPRDRIAEIIKEGKLIDEEIKLFQMEKKLDDLKKPRFRLRILPIILSALTLLLPVKITFSTLTLEPSEIM